MPFPENFLWGTATASYQVEGAAAADGRGLSIWDTFCRTPGKVYHGHNGDVASDQYHRYAEDVDLMVLLGVNAYRFSTAWPRVFPKGYGKFNPKGFDYYNRLVDELLNHGIEPAITLYHWDLPQALEEAGGWPDRDTAYRFADYAGACFEALGDRVKRWITLNEPLCSAYLGYEIGIHAPGRKSKTDAVKAVHHLLLGHGFAVERFRSGNYGGEIGITLNLQTPRPARRNESDELAASMAADKDSRMFTGPLFGKGYPERYLSTYPELHVPAIEDDLNIISAKMDFLGLNYYSEQVATVDKNHPEGFGYVPTWQPEMPICGGNIIAEGLVRQLQWVVDECGEVPMYITENGCAVPDELTQDGTRCHDIGRIEYVSKHLSACSRAIKSGLDLRGYFLWSFIDNFEWAYGYSMRLGIVYCDYLDHRRVCKDSFYYYRDVIAGYELID